MKKIIYIIPILLLSIFLVNNVYAANYVDTIDDLYNLAETDRTSLGSNNWSDMWSGVNFNYTKLINSSTFQNKSKSYSYYTIFANYTGSKTIYVLFSNEEPTLTLYKDSSYNYNCKFDNITNYTFTQFSASSVTEYDVSKISSSTWYSNSSACEVALLKLYSNSVYAYRYTLKDEFINNICTNYDLKYTSSSINVIPSKNPIIQLQCEYNSDFSQATLTAFILNAKGGEKLYYSGDIIFNSGLNSGSSEGQHSGGGSSFGEEVDSLFQLYNTPVSFTTNRVVTFKLCDSNNNFICQSSYNITQIQNFNGVSFDVSFDTSNSSYLIFTPTISALDNSYYSIYCKINTDTSDLLVTRNGNRFSDYSDTNYTLLSNNETITLKYTGLFSANINIDFEIRNKNNGAVVLTRTYSYKISKSSDSTLNDIVENGASTGGGLGSGFSSLNENSSINDIIETSKESFNTFSSIFGLLPGFIWAFLATILIVLIVLRVLGR